MTRFKTLLVACALALPIPAAVAGCGGGGSDSGGGGDSSADPNELISKTFNNDAHVTSGNVNVSIEGTVSGNQSGSFSASLSGPFQGDPDKPSSLPQLDFTGKVKAEGAGQNVDYQGSAIVTDDDAYLVYNDQAYDVGKDNFAKFKSGFDDAASKASGGADSGSSGSASFTENFKKGCEDAVDAQGGDPSTCDFDVSSWFTDLSNAGSEDVEGTQANHVAGSLDVPAMLADLAKIGTSVPSASQGLSPDAVKAQIDKAGSAIKNASFNIYSGADDNLLRKLDFTVKLDPSAIPGAAEQGVDGVDLTFSITLSDVNGDQTIEAPSNAKPISDLTAGLSGLSIPGLGSGSIPGLGGSSGASGGAGASGGGNTDAYFNCIAQSKPEDAAKCASKIQ